MSHRVWICRSLILPGLKVKEAAGGVEAADVEKARLQEQVEAGKAALLRIEAQLAEQVSRGIDTIGLFPL